MSAGGKVLVVLNDASEARAVSERLRAVGIETLTATDGITGLALASESKPDVLLCSRTLPKLDGLEVCRIVKSNHKLRHVAVLIVLDEGDDSQVLSSLEGGATDYVVRPIHMRELVAAVRSHLQSKTSITRLRDDNKELTTILEISELLTSTLNSADLVRIIVDRVGDALAAETCELLRIEAGEQLADVEAARNAGPDHRHVKLADVPEVRRCLASGKIVYVDEVRRDAELSAVHGEHARMSVLAVPLTLRQTGMGRIVFRLLRTGDPLTYREIKFCQIVTTVAANALENAWLYESLEIAHASLTEIAKKDPLTDVHNRRHLFDLLEGELTRSIRKSSSLACILLDVDHFKLVNDEYGHQAGDRTLVSIAHVLRQCLRGQDVVGRYGGEEFLVVLPETEPSAARMVAERIRRAVREHEIPALSGKRVTVSLGIAVREPGDVDVRTVETLVSMADTALYEAKRAGRDRCVLHEPEAVSSGRER